MSKAITVSNNLINRFSLLWIRKQLTYFRLFDTRGRGALLQSDIVDQVKDRAVKILPKDKLTHLPEIRDAVWNTLWSPATSKSDQGVEVKWEDFLASRSEAVWNDKLADESRVKDIAEGIFKLADLNGDGDLQRSEHLKLLSLYGMTKYQAAVSFASLDTDVNGCISKAELSDAIVDFFHNPRRSSGTLVFGRLTNTDILIDEVHQAFQG